MHTLRLAPLLLLASCLSQDPDGLALGGEIQQYPAGVIPGLRAELPIGERDVLSARLAGNFTERDDWGEHDDEEGDGFGGGIGWRHFREGRGESGWLWGARIDLWDLEIDWLDRNPVRTGTTDILVLQPTAEVGYAFQDWSGGRIDLTLGLGAEINIDTDGEDVGEGAILLLGLTWMP